MKFPKRPEHIKEEIYLSIDKNYTAGSLRYRQLRKILIQVDNTLIVEGLIQVFEDTSRGQRSFEEQDFAGKLLYELKPDTAIPLPVILHRILPNYNRSVGELPQYMVEKYGLNSINEHLQLLENNKISNADILQSIKTFKFWLHIK